MASINLDENIVLGIKTNFLPLYKDFLKSYDGKIWIEEREERSKRYSILFSPENIEHLTEEDLSTVISELWANAGWTNKQYIVDRVLKSNDLNTLRKAFKDLLWGSKPLRKRFGYFFKSTKGLGPAQTTEIMCMVKPDEYCIWNERSRKALRILSLNKVLPVHKYRPTGKEYEKFVALAKEIASLLQEEELGKDLLDVDLFLYVVQLKTKEAPEEDVEIKEDYLFDHDEIVDKLIELGSGLGFEAEGQKHIATGAKVDVVWRAKIGNLGVINYVFEVHRAGSIDSAIMNLWKAKSKPTVQKLIIVSNTKNLKAIEKEVEALPEVRKSISYMEVKDILEASQLLQRLNEILSKLELVGKA